MSGADSMAATSASKMSRDKNSHLKGRKRFAADLADVKEICKKGFHVQSLHVKDLRSGDDEGAIEFTIFNEEGSPAVSVSLLASDTSDYPQSHSWFCYSSDSDPPTYVVQVLETATSGPSQTLHETLEKLLATLSGAISSGGSQQTQDMDTESDNSDGDYDQFDEYESFATVATNCPKFSMTKLQTDFIETVASGYRPGCIRFDNGSFALCVSIPVITLANFIPPRALMAWDRRLLSRSQHLTILISGFRGVYPPVGPDGNYSSSAKASGSRLDFKVGLTERYKPGNEHAQDVGRTFGLIINDAEDELRIREEAKAKAQFDWDVDPFAEAYPLDEAQEIETENDDGRFDKFSLSSSLESLLDQSFLKIIQLRREFGIGWAGGEVLLSESEKTQMRPQDIYNRDGSKIIAADREELSFLRSKGLPDDPLPGESINLPLVAFCYLLRRLSLCTRFCLVCHNKLTASYEALKPYVCDSKLCTYQYYSLNRGPSLEYEIIHNTQTVDLLVSLAYIAIASKGVDDLPVEWASVTTLPQHVNIYGQPLIVDDQNKVLFPGPDGLVDFDDMGTSQMRRALVALIDSLPAIPDMKKHLERKVQAGKSKPKLKDMDPDILPAAWSVLRWCVASCTAYIEEITSGPESVKNLGEDWRQFRFSVGAPDAEASFKAALEDAQATDKHARQFPSLYAFHGSPLGNWHSIIRNGLWYKVVSHGRAFGDGVYLAKEGNVSLGYSGHSSTVTWRNSTLRPANCTALTEVVNLPQQFVSQSPYFVVKDTHWIMCRYLLVKGTLAEERPDSAMDNIPMVALDPKHPITLNGQAIKVPQPSFHLENILQARQQEQFDEDNDEIDTAIFQAVSDIDIMSIADDTGLHEPPSSQAQQNTSTNGNNKQTRRADDWVHDPGWVERSVEHLLPPPSDASPSATMAVQRELRAMLTEQDRAASLKELGWYMPPDLIGDNLFQWIVEMHSFDSDIPIAQDLRRMDLNSIIFEIRFPPTFPLSPPFFRIVTPRFLPFIQGGGGHITGGGSICMDLLTSDGWLPSYSIPAVLMQIKLAISNLDPRPARLAYDWQRAYAPAEALEGYKRAAATHGWQVRPTVRSLDG
ncbi:hypothetical protein BD779DRAFT_1549574 [Infundibulicybe gibba]|nr:hypothetical protein BD779DRAFT_1549574 [Infundibulicybe gibba]